MLKMALKDPEEFTYETAEQLWLALSPTNQFRGGLENFVYRGQGDSTLPLLPTLLRCTNRLPIFQDQMVHAGDMVFHERVILKRFVKHCDAVGLPIPHDSSELRASLDAKRGFSFDKHPSLWPLPAALNLIAMAQHHGVPTRLLDWTTKAYTAAYFAASSALNRFDRWTPESKLIIWALDRLSLDIHPDIVLHYSPGSTSPHLAAQGGLFTVHPSVGPELRFYPIRGLDEHLRDVDYNPFIKMTLPVNQAPELLRLCSIAGFNGANVYPTADGAGRAVLDDINSFAAYTVLETFDIK